MISGLSDSSDRTAHDACLGSDNIRMGAAACLHLANDVSDVFFGSVMLCSNISGDISLRNMYPPAPAWIASIT